MPPKLILPMRDNGSSPVMLSIFPGMARHIFDLRFTIYDFMLRTKGGNDLTESNPTIVWRNALMPIRLESFRSQSPHRPFGQITILKTAAAQHHAPLADFFCHSHHGFSQRIMKLHGNPAGVNVLL